MVQKTVNAKAKVGLRSSTMIWDLDIRCPKGYCLFHNSFLKVQNQDFKNSFCFKKSKFKDLKLTLSYDNIIELTKKKIKKNKKKRF